MIQFSKEAWFLWVGTLLLGTGINVSLNAGDLHEVCMFVGGEMVGTSVLVTISTVWHMARRSTDGNLPLPRDHRSPARIRRRGTGAGVG